MTDFFFSPYGVPPREFKEKGNNRKLVMKHWRRQLPEDQRITTYNKWQDDRLAEISHYIWPRYDPVNDTWIGAAVDTAKSLTEFEVDLMINEFMHPFNILNKRPSSPLAVPAIENHLKHYEYEDKEAPGFNYRQYDRTLQSREEELFLERMLVAVKTSSGVGEKMAGHFYFKSQLQRPRPLHAALRLNLEENFESELSERGQHPSIVSGHCLQGIMMCCAVLEDWLKFDPKLNTQRRESLAQYMVDIGDRRVFAGVHYPSDNIASWALALSLIPEVFQDHETIRAFVVDAILNKSAVYRVIDCKYLKEKRANSAMEFLSDNGLLCVG